MAGETNKLLAVIRVRGRIGVRRDIGETLKRLNLKSPNNMILLPATSSNVGMIKKCNDFVTYGEADPAIIEKVLSKKGIKAGKEALESIAKGEKPLAMPIRLHPPAHGYEGTKVPFSRKGALGYRGSAINKLIARMA
ncbi:MAG: uL30 family ribosomal protein [Candidatus Micrarchaeaceae archaeon]